MSHSHGAQKVELVSSWVNIQLYESCVKDATAAIIIRWPHSEAEPVSQIKLAPTPLTVGYKLSEFVSSKNS